MDHLLAWSLEPLQEGNKDLHALLEHLADSQLKAKGLARGRKGSEQERAVILAGFWRTLSIASAKANSSCLLDRVAKIGEQYRSAALVKRVETRVQEERLALCHANVRGRGILRGQFVRM